MTAVMTMSITIKKPQHGSAMAQQSRNWAVPESTMSKVEIATG